MRLLRKVLEEIMDFLDVQEKTRERILDISRRSIRKSSRAMAALHREDEDEVEEAVNDIQIDIESLNEILESEPRFSDYGSLLAAHREYAEVIITRELINGKELPDLEDIGVQEKAYLQALAESIGELRRHLLDLLREDEIDKARDIYDRMEEIFDKLVEFDYPDSILPGFKHRRDVARRIIESTRGDLTNAVRQQKLEKSLKQVKRRGGD